MIGLDELVRRVAGLERTELTRWIENRWILPEPRGAGGSADAALDAPWQFHEVDVARVELIFEIRREFAVDDEATELLLRLLDQLYSLRRQMRRLCDAVEAQPADIREAIRRALPPGRP